MLCEFQCTVSSVNYDLSTLAFIDSHPLMKDVVNPVTGTKPSYYSKELSFSKLEVDFVGSATVFFLYFPGNYNYLPFYELYRLNIFSNITAIQVDILCM